MICRRRVAALFPLIFCSVALRTEVHAQDLEPRAYSNSPIGLNFFVAGYGYTKGAVLVDPSLPIENVSNEAHLAAIGLATTVNVLGQSSKLEVIVPYASLAAKGMVFNMPHARYISGLGDPAFRFSMNFIGAPALTAAEFANYRQNFILGASLRVVAPLGQYDDTKLVNVGSNRWSIKPEIGFSKAFGRWTIELAPAVTLYTDNGDFFGGHTRTQAPLYAAQAHISYTFSRGCWVGLDGTYFLGGRSTVDDVENDDRQQGTRWGATFALSLTRYQSVKFYAVAGLDRDRHRDFDAVGIAWQYRWGGGY